MRYLIRTLALAAACTAPLAASAADPLARFEGGIGSQPLAAAGGVNDVLGVPPGGRPWVISELRADVRTDGSLKVDGRGLLLGGGANVGRTNNQRVNAMLICDGVRHLSEQQVLLEPNGDFRITGFLVPRPPAVCNNAILLIVNANGSWFAAGIPR